MQVTTKVFDRYEIGELLDFDLSDALSHLGRDERQLEGPIDGGFGLGGDHLAGLGVFQTVLIEQQPAIDGPLAQLDVVLFGAGEIEDCRTELIRSDYPQIDLEAGGGENGCLGVTAADHLGNDWHGNECSHNGIRFATRSHDVDVGDGFAESPE